MKLKSLHLKDYRNYSDLTLNLDDGLTILTGKNAQGKTNLLEAIFLLSLTKSHRTHHDQEMIAWQAEDALIEGVVENKNVSYPLSLQISKKGKIAKFNHLEQAKLSQFIGKLHVVLFAPEDLQIIKGSPALRRRFIDSELGQTHPVYIQELQTYNRLLKQRNKYLKDKGQSKDFDDLYYEVMTDQFIDQAIKVINYRKAFIQSLSDLARPIHSELSANQDVFTIIYQASSSRLNYDKDDQVKDQFTELIHSSIQRERDQGQTFYGPHRDDISFLIDGKPAQTMASQGQQRTIILSLKLAELDLIHNVTGDYPVLLLDDVLSELDHHRQDILMKRIKNQVQTVLTTAGIEGLPLDDMTQIAVYEVSQGTLSQVNKGD